jgi:RNA-splicing ligase RtcB
MEDIAQQVARLRREAEEAGRRHAAAAAGVAEAETRERLAAEELRAEFQADGLEDAERLLALLRQQVAAEAANVEEQLTGSAA